jgi:jumonji domain-containing protein 7
MLYNCIAFQVQGSKRFRLLDPERNERLREGHMREAQLEAAELRADSPARPPGPGPGPGLSPALSLADSARRFAFRRSTLLESTSMVHSPVDISDISSSDGGGSLPYMDCEVRPGEALYVPSFWWHEVASRPSAAARDPQTHTQTHTHTQLQLQLNLAVNFWFAPVFAKSFPCARCRKRLDAARYGDILRDMARAALL